MVTNIHHNRTVCDLAIELQVTSIWAILVVVVTVLVLAFKRIL